MRGQGLQTKISNAVLDTGTVGLYIPWQFGVDYDTIGRGSAQDSFDEQLDVRDLLRDSKKRGVKTDWIIVSTGIFTSFLFQPWFGVVTKNSENAEWTVRPLGKWDDRVTVTGPDDIGRVSAEIVLAALGGQEGLRNEVVFIASDTVSYKKLADVVEEVTGGVVKRGDEISLEQAEEELRQDPTNVVKKYRVIWVDGRGVNWPMEKTYNARKNMSMEGIETWARRNLNV